MSKSAWLAVRASSSQGHGESWPIDVVATIPTESWSDEPPIGALTDATREDAESWLRVLSAGGRHLGSLKIIEIPLYSMKDTAV